MFPSAFVDESFWQPQGRPGAYLMSAVIIDQDDVAPALAAASAAARGQPYHSSELYHRGHVGIIEDMLDVAANHAGWSAVSLQIPLDTRPTEPSSDATRSIHRVLGEREYARQASLEQLLRYLNTQRVRDVYLESRASHREWQQARTENRRVPTSDRNDIRTYRRLLEQHAISHRVRIVHIKDHTHPGLWLADAVAWSVGRAIRTNEPQWFNRITDTATIIEATTGKELHINERGAAPPIGERDPHNLSQRAQIMSSPTAYPTTTTPDHTPNIYTTLLQQAEQARNPAAPLAQQLLNNMQILAVKVQQLQETVDRLTPHPRATTQQAEHSPHLPTQTPSSPHQPIDSEPELP